MKKEVAEEVVNLALECGEKLDSSLAFVRDNCSNDEFEAYKTSIGKIMGGLLLDIMNPIFREHPSLKPEKLR
jgi:hypothetical protein